MKKIILTFAIFFISLVGFGQDQALLFFNQGEPKMIRLDEDIYMDDTLELDITVFEGQHKYDSIYFNDDGVTFLVCHNSEILKLDIDEDKDKNINCTAGTLNFYLKINSTSSITENSVTDLNVYPNPSTDYINIDFNSLNEVSITIYSIDGRVMYNTNTYQSETINIQDYPNGMYIVRVNDEMKKIIKQ